MGHSHSRRGFTLLELQVAFVVFALAMAGLCPLVVMESRHFRNIEASFNSHTTYYLVPSSDEWARKLGAAASMRKVDPGPAAEPALTLVDDIDLSFSTIGDDWTSVPSTDALHGSSHHHEPGDSSVLAKWEFTGIAPGWYDVRATWLEEAEQASDAKFSVFDDATSEGTFEVNQQVAPSGEEHDDRPWQSLGVFLITDGKVRVELSADADQKVVADGIRLVPVVNDVQINAVDKSFLSEATTAHVSVTVVVP